MLSLDMFFFLVFFSKKMNMKWLNIAGQTDHFVCQGKHSLLVKTQTHKEQFIEMNCISHELHLFSRRWRFYRYYKFQIKKATPTMRWKKNWLNVNENKFNKKKHRMLFLCPKLCAEKNMNVALFLFKQDDKESCISN